MTWSGLFHKRVNELVPIFQALPASLTSLNFGDDKLSHLTEEQWISLIQVMPSVKHIACNEPSQTMVNRIFNKLFLEAEYALRGEVGLPTVLEELVQEYVPLAKTGRADVKFIRSQITRLETQSHSLFSINNKMKADKITVALNRALADPTTRDVRDNALVKEALATHRIFSFFDYKPTTATQQSLLSRAEVTHLDVGTLCL